ncbi:hypothetical protein ABPG75_002734 [Micractinium tetrahymenae]
MGLLMGRSEVAANVFVLGIAPLMSAYFVLAVANIFPPLRKHFAELREAGPSGREAYTSYLTALFVCFAGYEAVSLARSWLPASAAAGAAAAGAPPGVAAAVASKAAAIAGWAGRSSCVLWYAAVMTAGATICKQVTQMVEQHGLGDGTGLLIALGVAANYAHFLQAAGMQLAAAPPSPLAALAVAAMCAALVGLSLWAQGTQLHLPITFYKDRQSPARIPHPLFSLLAMPPKQQHRQQQQPAVPAEEQEQEAGKPLHFPLQLSPSGARSLLFANFWVALLQPPFSWLGLANPFESAVGFAALVLVVEGVTFADMTPRQISQYLSGSDAGIQGLSPGDATIAFLAAKRRQLKLLNAALLAVLSLAAKAVDAASAALIGVPAGCLSLLLLASTVASGVRQVEALSRAPLVERLVAREEAAMGRGGRAIVMPESTWN